MEIAVTLLVIVAFAGFVVYRLNRKVEATRPVGVSGGRPKSPDVHTHEA